MDESGTHAATAIQNRLRGEERAESWPARPAGGGWYGLWSAIGCLRRVTP